MTATKNATVIRRRQGHLGPLVVLLAIVVLAAACGGSGSDAAEPPPDAQLVDWSARTVDLQLPDRWEVAFCEGEAPLLCVERAGRPIGGVELLDLHRASLPGFEDVEGWADDLFDSIRTDRAEGCGPGYRLEKDPSRTAAVAGDDGVRYSFTGFRTADRPAERAVGYALVRDDTLFLIGANAYEADGCIGTEGGEFTVETLREFEPILAEIAAASRLPRRAGDGTASGFVREVRSSGVILLDRAVVLDGQAATDAARDAGVIGPGEELESDFFLLDADPRTVELQLTERTRIQLYDCTAACALRDVSLADFQSGTARANGGRDAIYSVILVDGEVVGVTETYLP